MKDYVHFYLGCKMKSNTTGRVGTLNQVRVDDTDYGAKLLLRNYGSWYSGNHSQARLVSLEINHYRYSNRDGYCHRV